MSYCRMENTARDLQDVVDSITSGDYDNGISHSEKRGLDDIYALAREIVEDLEYEIEEILNNDK
jgi:hypothetical protein